MSSKCYQFLSCASVLLCVHYKTRPYKILIILYFSEIESQSGKLIKSVKQIRKVFSDI